MATFEAQNPDYAAQVPAVVLSMPAAAWLGMQFTAIAPGQVTLTLPFRAELGTHMGAFQGGVIGMLADFAGGSAAGTLLPIGWINATADFTVKLLTPAAGERLIARAQVLQPGKTLTVASVEVFTVRGEVETLCAAALVTMRNMPLG